MTMFLLILSLLTVKVLSVNVDLSGNCDANFQSNVIFSQLSNAFDGLQFLCIDDATVAVGTNGLCEYASLKPNITRAQVARAFAAYYNAPSDTLRQVMMRVDLSANPTLTLADFYPYAILKPFARMLHNFLPCPTMISGPAGVILETNPPCENDVLDTLNFKSALVRLNDNSIQLITSLRYLVDFIHGATSVSEQPKVPAYDEPFGTVVATMDHEFFTNKTGSVLKLQETITEYRNNFIIRAIPDSLKDVVTVDVQMATSQSGWILTNRPITDIEKADLIERIRSVECANINGSCNVSIIDAPCASAPMFTLPATPAPAPVVVVVAAKPISEARKLLGGLSQFQPDIVKAELGEVKMQQLRVLQQIKSLQLKFQQLKV